MQDPIVGAFPNIALNTVPHLDLVQFIERAMQETVARTILTHHPSDLNNDHLQVSLACQAAARLWQRKASIAPLQALYYMEIASSTDWAFPSAGHQFRADAFMALTESEVALKLEALALYTGVMRPAPHSRSPEVIRATAVQRGAQAFVPYAEAFQSAFVSLRETMFMS